MIMAVGRVRGHYHAKTHEIWNSPVTSSARDYLRTRQALERLDRRFALGLQIESHEVGLASLKRTGSTLAEPVVAACRAADGFILGPVSHLDYPPRAQGGLNPSGDLRIALDLYANVRPSRCYEGLPHWGRTPMDLVIVRENTEGFYADRNMHQGAGEFMPTPELALSVRKISSQASRRIAQVASASRAHRPEQGDAGHKGNVLKATDGLFARSKKNIQRFPDVTLEEQQSSIHGGVLVRDAAPLRVRRAQHVRRLLSDELRPELSGSLGLAGSLNAGGRHAWRRRARSAPTSPARISPIPARCGSAGMSRWLGRRLKNSFGGEAANGPTRHWPA